MVPQISVATQALDLALYTTFMLPGYTYAVCAGTLKRCAGAHLSWDAAAGGARTHFPSRTDVTGWKTLSHLPYSDIRNHPPSSHRFATACMSLLALSLPTAFPAGNCTSPMVALTHAVYSVGVLACAATHASALRKLFPELGYGLHFGYRYEGPPYPPPGRSAIYVRVRSRTSPVPKPSGLRAHALYTSTFPHSRNGRREASETRQTSTRICLSSFLYFPSQLATLWCLQCVDSMHRLASSGSTRASALDKHSVTLCTTTRTHPSSSRGVQESRTTSPTFQKAFIPRVVSLSLSLSTSSSVSVCRFMA